ncbi:MAG: fibrobacter succinogenes major paralogous domain-containing protein [Bacteroidales bacterium]|nr:fibrobacter succinogenes major paralogous domain-containing protein [Bacteroidales bacterium]
MIKLFLTIIIAGVCTLLQAQTRIENITFKQVGNNIVVNYDLYCIGSFDAQLFYSTNNGISWYGPLNSITGDVHNVKSGMGKSIMWDVLKEQNLLFGDNIRFKVAVEPNTGTFTDTRDNQTYKWVKIGVQKWMAENLNYDIGHSWCYDNDSVYCNKYGRLYKWKTAKNVCPIGWHLPTDDEWKQLEVYLGMILEAGKTESRGTNEGEKLKAVNGWNSWRNNNGNGTDDYGFTALPGGSRSINGSFSGLGRKGSWWSATEFSGSLAWFRGLYFSNHKVNRYHIKKSLGFSVRCVKD